MPRSPCQIILFLTCAIPVFALLLLSKIFRGVIFPFVCLLWNLCALYEKLCWGILFQCLKYVAGIFPELIIWNLLYFFPGCCSIFSFNILKFDGFQNWRFVNANNEGRLVSRLFPWFPFFSVSGNLSSPKLVTWEIWRQP